LGECIIRAVAGVIGKISENRSFKVPDIIKSIVSSITPYIQHLIHRLSRLTFNVQRLTSKCITFYNLQDYQKAIEFGKLAIQNNANSRKAYIYLAKTYYHTGELTLAYDNLKKAESLASSEEEILDVYREMGRILRRMGKLDDAYMYLIRALNLAREMGNIEMQGVILNDIGGIYYDKGELDKAFNYYLDSLHLAFDEKVRADIYNNIALIYCKKDKCKKAVIYLQKVIEIVEKQGDFHRLSIYKLNLGYAYTKLKNYKLAMKYLSEGLDGLEKIGDKYSLSMAYKYIAEFHKDRGEEELAREYYGRSET
jgi:tetratricopeptide (TPR) repeat protein